MAWWRAKAYECPLCGWQGMAEPTPPPDCPECGESLVRRSWRDTWGVTLLILGIVVAVVLIAAYAGEIRLLLG
jgi:hypothetical protein